jgi:ribosomal protein S18 acetylase RimI-like enzyme
VRVERVTEPDEELVAALDLAREAGVATVHLTTRVQREAANRLYRRLGFEPHETNVYVWTPE